MYKRQELKTDDTTEADQGTGDETKDSDNDSIDEEVADEPKEDHKPESD